MASAASPCIQDSLNSMFTHTQFFAGEEGSDPSLTALTLRYSKSAHLRVGSAVSIVRTCRVQRLCSIVRVTYISLRRVNNLGVTRVALQR